MESIFENLENLNVSEECFNDIMSIVEEYVNELKDSTVLNTTLARVNNVGSKNKDFNKYMKLGRHAELLSKYRKTFPKSINDVHVSNAVRHLGRHIAKFKENPNPSEEDIDKVNDHLENFKYVADEKSKKGKGDMAIEVMRNEKDSYSRT